MDIAVTLARLQFAITTVYHFFFVPLTLGLSILVALMETFYVRTGNDVYRRMTRFWGKLFVINFATGGVTGIVQEFQFGMNWSEYSRYVGDIFGAPLAIEALLAFFLESTFLGVWIFGWNKLSKKVHLAAIWLVAISSNLSALWILIANSFMQQPVGYMIENGRARLTDFAAVVFNPNIFYQFPHVLTAGLVTASFLMLGISAYHLLRKNEEDLFRRSFKIAAVTGVVFSVLLGGIGHAQGQHMLKTQPMKMAAAEALWETEDPASFSLFAVIDEKNQVNPVALRIPAMLSLLSYNRLDGAVKGLSNLQAEYEALYGPGNYIPPVTIPFWAFRVMVGVGTLMGVLALYALFMAMFKNKLTDKLAWVMKFMPWVVILPYIGNSAGWIMTEVGRYPWVVYGLVRLEDGVSPTVSVGMLWTSLIGYVLIYGLLMVATIYLLRKYALAGPAATDVHAEADADAQPALAR